MVSARALLADAADQARRDGWLRWEADEYVAAVARKLDLTTTTAEIGAAVAAAYGEGGE